LDDHLKHGDDKGLMERKKEMKRELFKVVANQTGKLFDENVLTLVWARRFAGYKRANLLLRDFERFLKLISNAKQPIQIIWAGKPYPEDYGAIHIFNDIIVKTKHLHNCAVLTGYEMQLSGLLKKGSDLWLNTPTMYREASGTSGMTAAMNGSLNLSIPDGWIPEFSRHGENCFIIEPSTSEQPEVRDDFENNQLLTLLEDEIIPCTMRSQNRG
jgi:Glucan phosphorylase